MSERNAQTKEPSARGAEAALVASDPAPESASVASENVCEPYVYPNQSGCRRYWTWTCPCGRVGPFFHLRREADTSAEDHQRGEDR